MSTLEALISYLRQTKRYSDTIVSTLNIQPQQASYAPLPGSLHPAIESILVQEGIRYLYKHQVDAIKMVLNGKNVVISTGVSSGKSLVYWLPILNELAQNKKGKALLLYPTKALAQDQSKKLAQLCTNLASITNRRIFSAIYDGDTPNSLRSKIRRQADVVASNPDMLHMGILPHHSLWSSLFSHLQYVVIDELHYYRGVLGSHFANVLRRLKRICRVYNVNPIFICTSATLGNARELAQNLIGDEVFEIFEDYSEQGMRHYMIVNPPIVEETLGIRRSSLMETASLAKLAMEYSLQSIVFSVTRRSVEVLLLHMPQSFIAEISAYRSGYLASHRRQIEKNLREGKLKLIISTNALELGIDIGGLDAAFINGYPGSIASVRQEAGRAGRKGRPALAILVAGSNPLDQYICRHPDYLWQNNPEQALIDPNNTEIFLSQLDCAVSELSLKEGESFGNIEYTELLGYLQILEEDGKIRKVGQKYLGITERYPAGDVSLRNAGNSLPILADAECVGYVDSDSAMWMTHPKAIYLHAGETWIVEELDLEKQVVRIQPFMADYYTQAIRETELLLEKLMRIHQYKWGNKHFGRIIVQSRVTGFKKIRLGNMENLGVEELQLPMQELDTVAWWISLAEPTVENIRSKGLWNSDPNNYGKEWKKICIQIRERDKYRCVNCKAKEDGKAWDVHHIVPFKKFASTEEANKAQNLITLCPRCHHLAEQRVRIQSGIAGLAYLIHNLAPLFVMCDPKDLGLYFEIESSLADGNPVIALYDMVPKGIGLCKKLYDIQEKVLTAAFELVSECECENGCPACVGPVAEMGEGAKEQAKAILDELLCR